MHLFILRHGECLGQIDPESFSDPDTALSELGQLQARQTAQRLAGENITQLISSPLIRALATASQIAESLGDCPLEVWPEVVEVNGRAYTGLSGAELVVRFPRATWPVDTLPDAWTHGGETYEGIFDRCRGVVTRLTTCFPAEARVALITHGGFANYLLHSILNIQPATPQWFELANCGISCVRFVPHPEQERPNWPLFPPVPAEILYLNDTAHLRTL